MAVRSLRARLVIGSVLWTIGIIAIAVLIATAFVSHRLTWLFFVHNGLLLGLAALCVWEGFAQLRRGLASFTEMRSQLGGVRTGQIRRIDGQYPAEVHPLVTELNALLTHNDDAVQRAVAKAGDLAHGLKTPLAVLAQDAEHAEAAGQRELAASIRQQIERMRRQIEYHLAHARAAASGATLGTLTPVAEAAEAIARTLRRLHASRGITIDVHVAASLAARVQREDLEEMLGNLMDNACKWARARVEVNASATASGILITVDDDGAGLAPDLREQVLRRGTRADESAPGSGLGLAIVRDLAELYGGSITLDASPLGGLRAQIQIRH